MMYRHYVALFVSITVGSVGAAPQDHAFTVKDDIAMVRFSDPVSLPGIPNSDLVRRSPDGKHFAVVTTKGLLGSDRIESQLSILDSDSVETFIESKATIFAGKPRIIATIVGDPHYDQAIAYAPVIKDVRWDPDHRHVYFKGENSTGAYQLYVASIDGAGFHALTPPAYSVDRFDVESGTIAYTASLPSNGLVDRGVRINQDAWNVTGYSLEYIIFPGQHSSFGPETFSLWVMRKVSGRWVTKQIPQFSFRDERYLSFLFPFKVSPNGDKLIVLTPVTKVPTLWQSYQPAPGYEHLRLQSGDPRWTRPDTLWKPQQYSLVNLITGKSVSLVNAPNARTLAFLDDNRLTWASDGRRILVTNTFLRLDHITSSESLQRIRPCAVASVDVPSMNARCLTFIDPHMASLAATERVLNVAFGADNNEALLRTNLGSGRHAAEKYILQDGVWTRTSSTLVSSLDEDFSPAGTRKAAVTDDLQLLVRQGLNDRPTLWGRDIHTGASRQLWDPNPQFAAILFGAVSEYRWKDATGHDWVGGLVKPVGYIPGGRYPLVIQMYSFYPGQFMTDGTDPTAFAARELASAGFMVLQIQKKPDTLTDADPQIALDGYRSAVERLSNDGLIDPGRVGAVGFSWTCWYVEYALINAPHLFAAATIADGLDNSYMDYLLFGPESVLIQRQMEEIHGSSPFGEGLKAWVAMAPSFQLDKVRTPLRIEAINPGSVLQEWELYSSLQMQSKPVDLIYFPHGTHILEKPLERLESQQGDVDWLRFWLQRYEDPDPSKAFQYARWRRLRAEKEGGDKPGF